MFFRLEEGHSTPWQMNICEPIFFSSEELRQKLSYAGGTAVSYIFQIYKTFALNQK